jgi:hypothetical protein
MLVRRAWVAVGALVIGLVVTACASSSPATPTPAASGAPTPTDSPAPTAPPALDTPGEPAPTATPRPTPTSAPTPTPANPPPIVSQDGSVIVTPIIVVDPDWQASLDSTRISTRVWETDFRYHTVDYQSIFSGGVGRDGGIRPLDDPVPTDIASADEWIGPLEPVIVLEIGDVARAYPLQIMTWHEIVNDELAGVPVTVTFCPLCNSAVVFDRRLDAIVYDFGVSGNLRNSDLIMWDRQTESWWQQLTGEGIVGVNAGRELTMIAAQIVSWDAFKASHPEGDAVSRDTGFPRAYGQNPYVGYDRDDNPPFLYDGDLDGRLLPKERIAAININDVDGAFLYSIIATERVVNYNLGGEDVVVFFEPGMRSALDRMFLTDSSEVGATGVFAPTANGQQLTFRLEGNVAEGVLMDNETGSTWSILGRAVAGPLEGTQLDRVVHQDHFWFAWAAFKPDTLIYEGAA